MSVHPTSRRRLKDTARAVVLAVLAVAAVHQVAWLEERAAIDFFRFWLVPQARRLSGGVLDNPYSMRSGYAAVREELRRTGSPRLREAARFPKLNLNQSPLLYAAVALLPSDYDRARRTYMGLQLVAWFAGLVLLMRSLRMPAWLVAAVGLSAIPAYMPLGWDLWEGNAGTLQFAWLAVGLAIVPARSAPRAAALFVVCVAGVLYKPNVAPVAAALLGVQFALSGPAVTWRGLTWAAPGVVALAAAPTLALGPVSLWWDWRRELARVGSAELGTLAEGNLSTLAVARAAGAPGWVVGVVGLAFAASLLLAARRWGRGREATLAARAVTLAVAAVLLVSPIVWAHYFVIAVVPCLLLLWRGGSPWARACGVAALVVSSGRVEWLWGLAGFPGALTWLGYLTGPVLWAGGLAWWAADQSPPTDLPAP